MNHISHVEEQRDKERKGMMKKGTSLSCSESLHQDSFEATVLEESTCRLPQVIFQ